MANLKEFSDAGTPLLEDLGVAAPALTNATRTLTPFSEATTTALTSLGKVGRRSGPRVRRSDAGGAEGDQAGDQRPGVDRRTRPALRQPEEDPRLGRAHRTDLQHRRLAQRLRQIRPLRPHPGDAHDLRRIRSERRKATAAASARFNGPSANESSQNQRPRADRPAQPAAAAEGKANQQRRHDGGIEPADDRPGRRRIDRRHRAARTRQRRRRSRRSAKQRPPKGPPNPFSTTSWANEESARRIRGEPGAGRRGDGAGDHRRRLPRLQRQQRPAVRLHLRPEGARVRCRRPGQSQRGADRRRPGRRGQVGGPGAAQERRGRSRTDPEPRQERRTDPQRLDHPGAAEIAARAEVPADHPGQLDHRLQGRRNDPGPLREAGTGGHRQILRHVQHADPESDPAQPGGLRQRARRAAARS